MTSATVLLMAFVFVMLCTRVITGESSFPLWRELITVAVGLAGALQPSAAPGQKEKLTVVSLATAVLGLALFFAAYRLFMLLVGVVFIASGLRGLVTGRVTVRGRVGPTREYTRIPAYLFSLLSIFFGLVALAGFIQR